MNVPKIVKKNGEHHEDEVPPLHHPLLLLDDRGVQEGRGS